MLPQQKPSLMISSKAGGSLESTYGAGNVVPKSYCVERAFRCEVGRDLIRSNTYQESVSDVIRKAVDKER
jgi:hypothetical protein